MDAFLSEARRAGSHDSHGVFTINADKAEVKIAKFQLAKTEQFPMFLLAAGTQAGAAGLEVTFPTRQTTRIRFQNWSLSPSDLHYIGTQALREDTPLSYRYLAIAFSTIGHRYDFAVKSGSLQVSFVDRTMCEVESREFVPEDVLQIEIEGDLEEAIWDGLTGQQKFCPFPVRIGHRELAGGYDPSTESLDSYAFFCRQGEGLGTVSLRYPSDIVLEMPPSEELPMVVSFTHAPEAGEIGFWLLVKGLACRTPRDFAPPGFYGVAVASGLQLSLSYELIENESFRGVRAQVWKACEMICRHAQSRLDVVLDPVQISMLGLTSTYLEREYSRQGVERLHAGAAFDRGAVSNSEVADGAKLAPDSDPEGLTKIIDELPNLPPEEVETLVRAYRDRASKHLAKGSKDDALSWYRALLRIKEAVQDVREIDLFLERLLVAEDLPAGVEFGTINCVRITTLVSYLKNLDLWNRGAQTEGLNVHPTWLIPMGIHEATDESWTMMIRLLEQEDVSGAMRLVWRTPDLFLSGSEYGWRSYFWTYHRGRLSWIETIALRVGLSFSEANSDDHDTLSVSELMTSVLGTQREKPAFWPFFLTLVERSLRYHEEGGRRACWTALIVSDILGQLLLCPDDFSLQEPFRPYRPLGR